MCTPKQGQSSRPSERGQGQWQGGREGERETVGSHAFSEGLHARVPVWSITPAEPREARLRCRARLVFEGRVLERLGEGAVEVHVRVDHHHTDAATRAATRTHAGIYEYGRVGSRLPAPLQLYL